MLETTLLLTFVFGLLFTAVTLVMGATHGGADGLHLPGGDGPALLPGDPGAALVPGHHPGDGHGAHSLNLTALMAGAMWFGGAGLIALKFLALAVPLVLGVALAAGAVAYATLTKLTAWLRASEKPLRAEDFVVEGTVARVSSQVPAGGVGEIVYTLGGAQRVEAARAADGGALPKGAEVVITGVERGIALVEDAETYIRS